jgi:uncharacterized protein (TIGR03083 family)
VYDVLYREARIRVGELASSLTDEQLEAVLAACPQWTGRQLVAHLVGVAADVNSGNLEGVTTPPWTAAQVEARKDRDLPQLLAEWDEAGPQLEQAIAERRIALQPVHDILVHEGDLRETHGLGRPPEQAITTMLAALGKLLARNHAGRPGGPLLRAGGQQWRLGDGEPDATVELDSYELYRGLFSRRSRRQLSQWPWQGDPTPFLDNLPVFGPRTDDQPTP